MTKTIDDINCSQHKVTTNLQSSQNVGRNFYITGGVLLQYVYKCFQNKYM